MSDLALVSNLRRVSESNSVARMQGKRRDVLGYLLGRKLSAVDAQLCAPGGLPLQGIHKILVCRPNHRLGNTLLISPLLREIEIMYPGAEIDIVSAGNAAKALYATRFQVRRVVGLPRRIARHPILAARLVRGVCSDRYDLAIDACLQSNMGRLFLAKCKARYKLGFPYRGRAEARLAGYLENCPSHFAQRNVHLLRVGCDSRAHASWPMLNVELSAPEITRGSQVLDAIMGHREHLPTRTPVLGIFANATGDKCYPQAWWQSFIDSLRACQPGVRIVDILAEHGHSQLPGATRPFYSRDLRKLAAVVANLDGFISADCGVMHLSCAVNTPTLGLFSRGNSAKYAPYGGINQAIDTSTGMNAQVVATRTSDWVDQLLANRQVKPCMETTK